MAQLSIRNRLSTALRAARSVLRTHYESERVAINNDLAAEGIAAYSLPAITDEQIEVWAQTPQLPEVYPQIRIVPVQSTQAPTSMGQATKAQQLVAVTAAVDLASISYQEGQGETVESALVLALYDLDEAIHRTLTNQESRGWQGAGVGVSRFVQTTGVHELHQVSTYDDGTEVVTAAILTTIFEVTQSKRF